MAGKDIRNPIPAFLRSAEVSRPRYHVILRLCTAEDMLTVRRRGRNYRATRANVGVLDRGAVNLRLGTPNRARVDAGCRQPAEVVY
jgi:hypothetical protein